VCPEVLAVSVARYAVIGPRTDRFRLQRLATVASTKLCVLPRLRGARRAARYQGECLSDEHQGMNAIGEAFERLVDVLRRCRSRGSHRQ